MMDEAQDISQLIGSIYDAALDRDLWPSALERSAAFVGGCASALFMKDSARKTHNVVITWGYDPDYTQRYVEKYVHLDPFTTGQFFFEIEQPVSLVDIMPPEQFRRTRFYEEWVRPQGWIDAIGVTLEKSVTTYSALSFIRHERHGMADESSRQRAKLLGPHVRRAVLIGKIIDLHKVEAAALADTLDGLAAAMFLVEASGRIVHANASGHALLADSCGVMHSKNGKLIAADARADHALQDVFLNAEPGDSLGAKGISVPLGERDGERWLAHVLPLTSGNRRRAATAYSAVAAVFVRKAAVHAPHPLEVIATTYKLTAAEMRVLMMIVEIGGVPEVAEALGISVPTVRTHLQHIFAKTNTSRQADLVKIVAGYMSPLRE
jgi:DNA-binding CsgD family transcriptional regulator